MLHDPSAHDVLVGVRWDESCVLEAVGKVVADVERAYGPTGAWPLHPLDAGEADDDWGGVSHGVYLGAAGMLCGLDRLARAGAAATSIDLRAAGFL